MPIWKVASIAEQPNIELADWQIVLVQPYGTRHLVGYNIGDREGRVSSAIVMFDAERRAGETISGRVYQLGGGPGVDQDADFAFFLWKKANRVTSSSPVTDQVLRGSKAAVESFEVVTEEVLRG